MITFKRKSKNAFSRSVFAIVNPSVVCNVRAPYSGGWNFRQYYFVILYLTHPLTSVQTLRRSSLGGDPSVGGVKLKRGSKIERFRVRVSNLLMSLLLVIVNSNRHPVSPGYDANCVPTLLLWFWHVTMSEFTQWKFYSYCAELKQEQRKISRCICSLHFHSLHSQIHFSFTNLKYSCTLMTRQA